jgi:hypothetical protein
MLHEYEDVHTRLSTAFDAFGNERPASPQYKPLQMFKMIFRSPTMPSICILEQCTMGAL